MSKHTQGPWETSSDGVPDWHTQISVYAESSGERVATVFQTEANARLIAAAPDLLKAAEDADETIQAFLVGSIPQKYRTKELDRITGSLRAAIAKTEG